MLSGFLIHSSYSSFDTLLLLLWIPQFEGIQQILIVCCYLICHSAPPTSTNSNNILRGDLHFETLGAKSKNKISSKEKTNTTANTLDKHPNTATIPQFYPTTMPFSRTALLSLLLPIMLILSLSSQSVSAYENLPGLDSHDHHQNQKVLQNADTTAPHHIPISVVNKNPKLAVAETHNNNNKKIIGLAGDSRVDEPLSYAHMGDQIHACAELLCPGSLISEYEFYSERNNEVQIENKASRMACIEYIEHEMTVEQRRGNKWCVSLQTFFTPLSLS